MRERTSNTIVIKRDTAATTGVSVARVIITPESRRKFKLMEDDYVELRFCLADAIAFEVGDYIDDEIFGRFVITEAQMPTYETQTSGYAYTLRFDAQYKAWNNRLHMLTTLSGATRIRKCATWNLCNTLAAQMDEYINGLEAIGYTGWSYVIKNSATEALEVKNMTYNGQKMLDALKAIADAWNTEYWIDAAAKVIYLGKCETTDPRVTLELENNVETMNVQRNQNTYANRVYVYGSTNNLPLSYRKALKLKVTGLVDDTETPGWTLWAFDRAITADMFPWLPSFSIAAPLELSAATISGKSAAMTARSGSFSVEGGKYQADLDEIYIPSVKGTLKTKTSGTAKIAVTLKAVNINSASNSVTLINQLIDSSAAVYANTTNVKTGAAGVRGKMTAELAAGTYRLELTITAVLSAGQWDAVTPPVLTGGGMAFGPHPDVEYSRAVALQYTFNGEIITAHLQINPRGVDRYADNGQPNPQYNAARLVNADGSPFEWIDEDGERWDEPKGWAIGTEITITDTTTYLVPAAFYSSVYDDPAALARLGDNRLQLPVTGAPNGYLAKTGVTDTNAVEIAVAFDDIYPDGKLIVAGVTAQEKTDYTEYEGESEKSAWAWHEYTLELKHAASGQLFTFNLDYMLPNVTLQLRFLTPQDINAAPADAPDNYKLAGMTFDVRYNRATNTFTLVRNNSYGALLPGEVLLPKVGDPCVLIGWDVRALPNLGLIADAESRLLTKGQEYLAALEDGQFTFDCNMMSGFCFDLLPWLELHEKGGRAVKDSAAKQIMVGNDPDNGGTYALLTEGWPVKIKHAALAANKDSRVIGYEFKLDKPYDTPKYVVGETDAYSVLAKLEKQITQISK